jgi:hypothetical protein
MLLLELARGSSTRSFSIHDARIGGWEFTEERDRTRVRTVKYTDWHRVERAAALISLEVADLERQGWTVVRESSRFDEPVA